MRTIQSLVIFSLLGCAHGSSATMPRAQKQPSQAVEAHASALTAPSASSPSVGPAAGEAEPQADAIRVPEHHTVEPQAAPIAGATPSHDGTVVDAHVAPPPAPVSDMTRPEIGLRERIQDTLLKQGSLSYSAQRVHIAVDRHDVTVSGDVHTARERADVEDVISKIRGVKRVHNQLAVIDQTRQPAPVSEPNLGR